MNPLKPTSVSTAGVHPLVAKSMLPRMAEAKQFTPGKRAIAMAQMPGAKRSLISRQELGSVRREDGRKPRA